MIIWDLYSLHHNEFGFVLFYHTGGDSREFRLRFFDLQLYLVSSPVNNQKKKLIRKATHNY